MLIHSNVYHHRNTWLHDPSTYSHVYPKRTLLKPHILQAKTVILHHHSTNTTLHSIYILYFYIHGIHFFFFLFSAELYMEFTYPHMFQNKPKPCDCLYIIIYQQNTIDSFKTSNAFSHRNSLTEKAMDLKSFHIN